MKFLPIYYGLSINQINFIVKNILEIDKLNEKKYILRDTSTDGKQ